ncbi:hypothetical protein OK016_23530 [Vibrio chagasii]|nr:hypothetical protein [Vibrio chagasii]
MTAIEDITGRANQCCRVTALVVLFSLQRSLTMLLKRMKKRIKTRDLCFTTLLNLLSQPGEVGAYINETIINAIEKQNDAKGFMDGRSLKA